MKTIIFFILCVLCCMNNNNISTNNIKYIEIRKVDFEILTFFHIDCDFFDKTFGKDKYTISVSDKYEIERIVKLINALEMDKSNRNPDVRAKLLIHYTSNNTDTICMDSGTLMYNNNYYTVNKELINYINELFKKELEELLKRWLPFLYGK